MSRLFLVLAVVVAGCAYIEPTPVETTIDVDARLDELEHVYIDALYEWSADQPRVTVVDVAPDSDLIELAYLTCLELERGTTHSDIADQLVAEFPGETDFQNDMAFIIGTANGVFCPWESGE